MNNSTLSRIPGYPMNPNSWYKLYTYAIYFIEGNAMFIGNMCLALAIWYHKALRANKGYFVFAFMFFCDSLNGLAQVFASVYRTSLLFAGTHDILVTRWDCMLKLHTYVWAFAEPTAAMMLAVISLDRLFLLMDPGKYMKSMKLTYLTIATPFVWNLSGLCVAFITAYYSPRDLDVAQYCLLSFGLGKVYWGYHGIMSVLGAAVSITIYVAAILTHRKFVSTLEQVKDFTLIASLAGGLADGVSGPRTPARSSDSETADLTRPLAKLTIKASHLRKRRLNLLNDLNLGFSCTTTFFVFLIPRLIGTGLDYSDIDRGTVSTLMMIFYWILGNFNAVINMFIFLRVDTIRKGVVAMLHCKTLPLDLRDWNNTNSQATGSRFGQGVSTIARGSRALPRAYMGRAGRFQEIKEEDL